MRKSLLPIAFALTVTAMIPAGAAIAAKAPDVEIASQQLSYQEADLYRGTVECADGLVATSVGLKREGIAGDPGGILDLVRDDVSTWSASGWSSSLGVDILTARATCAKLPGASINVRSKSYKRKDKSKVKASASCKSGEKVIAGGFKVPDTGADTVSSTYPRSSRTWTVTVDASSGPKGKVYAVCLKTSKYSIKVRSKSESKRAAGRSFEVSSTCPAKHGLVGGGAKLSSLRSIYLSSTYPKSVTRWTTEAQLSTNPDGKKQTATSYAICASKK